MPSLAGVNCQLWFDDNEIFDFSFGKKAGMASKRSRSNSIFIILRCDYAAYCLCLSLRKKQWKKEDYSLSLILVGFQSL